jgi:hypothetical protein
MFEMSLPRTLVPGQLAFSERQALFPNWLRELRARRMEVLQNARKKEKAPKDPSIPKVRKPRTRKTVIPPDVQARLDSLSPEVRKALGF